MKYFNMLIILFFCNISLMKKVEASDIWLNSLNCMDYTEKELCLELDKTFKEVKLTNFEKLTFDNQLKKITYLINKDKINIAKKRYQYFLELLSENLDEKTMEKIYNNKKTIWTLLFNYSKSSDYIKNPKYKI